MNGDIPLEPTPLGPIGNRHVVQQVSLIDSASDLLQDNHVDDMVTFFDALNPLVINSRSATESSKADSCYMLVREQGFTTSSLLPAANDKKRCRVNALLEPLHDGKLLKTNSTKINRGTTNIISGKDQAYEKDHESDQERFRSYQFDQWQDRFQDLVDFRGKHGHCLVPHNFPQNQQLPHWVKRQRYQYKLKQLNRGSTLTDERPASLEDIGFVWDSHRAAWMERLESLKEFRAQYGHCNVPSYHVDRSLAIWVKSQRRQYKSYQQGSRSTMTVERFTQLNQMGFSWNPRNLK